MDSRKNKHVIAVAITPKFAHAIISGKKSVEFRRNGAPTKISHMVLQILWREFWKYGWINQDDFNSYYEGQSTGKCYIIEKSFEFIRPISLSNCRSFTKAPQSFVYMEQSEWNNLKRKKKIAANHGIEWTRKSLAA